MSVDLESDQVFNEFCWCVGVCDRNMISRNEATLTVKMEMAGMLTCLRNYCASKGKPDQDEQSSTQARSEPVVHGAHAEVCSL